jgi:signal peptidase II
MARNSFARARGSFWPWIGWAVFILIIDQLTKTLILGAYRQATPPITSFFNIVRAHNTGAAFSFLANAGGWQRWFFTGIGVAATLFIVWQLRQHPGQKLFAFSLASILGGAVGNVVDRLLHARGGFWTSLGGLAFSSLQCGDSTITLRRHCRYWEGCRCGGTWQKAQSTCLHAIGPQYFRCTLSPHILRL